MSDSLNRYLNFLSVRSRVTRKGVLLRFLDYCNISADDAVLWQKDNPGDYRFIDLFHDWIRDIQLTISSKKNYYGVVCGFFLANRCPLPKDRYTFRSEVTPVIGSMNLEEFKQILGCCNLNYRAAYLCMFQAGLGVGELCYLNEHYSDYIFNEVKRGKDLVVFDLPGRKKKRNIAPYFSMFGRDSIDALRQLFHSRGFCKEPFVFMTDRNEPVSKQSLGNYFRRMATKVGTIKNWTPNCKDCSGETVRRRIVQNGLDRIFYVCTVCHNKYSWRDYKLTYATAGSIRYRLRTHEIRDLFRTEFHRASSVTGVDSSIPEFLMGHTIDPLGYNKIMSDRKYVVNEYRKALPYLNIISENPRVIERSEVNNRLEAQRVKTEILEQEILRLRTRGEKLDEIIDVLRDPKKLEKFKNLMQE